MIQFNKKQFDEICNDFQTLTGLQIVLYDDALEPQYTSLKHSPFCAALRKCDALKNKCLECDRNGIIQCKEQKKPYIYKCHMGLTEACAPILKDGVAIGYFLIGQTFGKNDIPEISQKISELSYEGIDKDELNSAILSMKSISHKRLLSAVNIMGICACYVWMNDIVELKQVPLHNKILSYISENISSPELCIQSICSHFNISRSLLYSISKKELGVGISEYIRSQRLQIAKKLLSKGELSISVISSECGFSTPSYFTRVFAENVGCLPKEYQQKENSAI